MDLKFLVVKMKILNYFKVLPIDIIDCENIVCWKCEYNNVCPKNANGEYIISKCPAKKLLKENYNLKTENYNLKVFLQKSKKTRIF